MGSTLGIKYLHQRNTIPDPLITKVTIDQKSKDSNQTYTLELMFQHPGLEKNLTQSTDDKVKFAIIKFETSKNSIFKNQKDLISDLVYSSFFPLAKDLILKSKSDQYLNNLSPEVIKIFSLKDFYEVFGSSTDAGEASGPLVNTYYAKDIKFESSYKNPQHVSFCVLPFYDISEIAKISNPSATPGINKLLRTGMDNFERRLAKRGNPQIFNYYKYDYMVVLNNHKVIEKGYLFERVDNKKIWTGTIHTRKEKYYTGRYVNDANISPKDKNIELRKISIPYSKIEDNRHFTSTSTSISNTFKDLFELYNLKNPIVENQIKTGNANNTYQQKVEMPNKFIHDFSTIDKLYNYNTMFVIDVPNMLLSHTLYPSVLQSLKDERDQLSEKILNGILTVTKIRKCEVFRRKVRQKSRGGNALTTNSDYLQDEKTIILSGDMNKVVSPDPLNPVSSWPTQAGNSLNMISDLNFASPGLAVFTFKENFVNKLGCKYQYKTKISFEDGVVRYLSGLAFGLIRDYETFLKESDLVMKKLDKYWNRKKNSFELGSIRADLGVSWVNTFNKKAVLPLVTKFCIALRMLSTSPIEYYKMQKAFVRATDFTTCTVDSFLAASNTIRDIIDRLTNMSELNNDIRSNGSSRSLSDGQIDLSATKIYNTSKNNIDNSLLHEEDFTTLLNIEKMGGYEYGIHRNNVSPGIKSISVEEFVSRFNDETSKYFDPDSLQTANAKSGPGANIETNKTRFFTPISYKLYNTQKNLPKSINSAARNSTKESLMDILFYQQGAPLKSPPGYETKFSSRYGIEKDFSILFGLTGINILESEVLGPTSLPGSLNKSTKEDHGIKRDTDSLESRTSNFKEKDWRSSVSEQSVDLDNIVATKTYKSFEKINSDNNNITNLILSSKVLADKLSLGQTYNKTTNYMKNKVADKETPNQTLSAILSLAGSQTLKNQANKKTNNNSSDIIDSLRQNDIPINALNVKILDDYGLWWFNYDNIVELMYLKSYSFKTGLTWSPLDFNTYQKLAKSSSNVFCKFEKKVDKSLNQVHNKFLDLNIFNKYFIIDFKTLGDGSVKPNALYSNSKRATTPGKDIYKMPSLASLYSSDFHKFVRADFRNILGKPREIRISKLMRNRGSDIIRSLTPVDYNNEIEKVRKEQ